MAAGDLMVSLISFDGGIIASTFRILMFVYFFSISSTTLIDRFRSNEDGGGEAGRVGGTLRTVTEDVLDGEPYCFTAEVGRVSLFSNLISSYSLFIGFLCELLGSATTRALFFILNIFWASLMFSMLNTRFLMV